MVDAALHVVDTEGIGALTMRRLGREVGVEAMTLYYHVGSKDELMNALVDRVTDEFAYAPDASHWRVAIRTLALSAYDALARHRWAAGLSISLRRPTAGRLRYMNAILGTLRRAGFTDELVDRGYHAIEGHIMGFTLWEVGMSLPADADLEPLATAFLADLDSNAFPAVAEHVRHHLRQAAPDEVGAFEFGLELILDGLERLLPAQHAG